LHYTAPRSFRLLGAWGPPLPSKLREAIMSQMYNVTVPQGVVAGMQFQAQVGGQVMVITCPPGAGPGSIVQVAGPPIQAQAMPVAQAQPAVSYAQPPPPAAYGQPGYAQQPAYAQSPPQTAAYPVAPQAKHMYKPQKGGANQMPPPPVHMQPTHALQLPAKLERLYLGLGWRSPRQGLDLDASAICFKAGRQVDLINFQRLRTSPQGESSVVHTGDVLTGQQTPGKMEDLERIYFWLPKMDNTFDMIYLVVNVFTQGATFADVTSAFCRLSNADSDQELGRFELTNLQGNAVIFARIEKHQRGHWQWVALGTLASGRTAHEVGAYIDQSPAMNAKPSAMEAMTGTTGGAPGSAKPNKQKPTKSWVAPALIGATAAGVAAAALIYTQPELRQDMISGVGNVSNTMDFSNISVPEMPIDIDLTPPEGVGEAFGAFAGSAVEAGGAFMQAAGQVGGQVVDSATAAMSGIDLSGVGEAAGNVGQFAGDGLQSAGAAMQPVGESMAYAGGGAMEAGEDCCGDCGACDCDLGDLFGGN